MSASQMSSRSLRLLTQFRATATKWNSVVGNTQHPSLSTSSSSSISLSTPSFHYSATAPSPLSSTCTLSSTIGKASAIRSYSSTCTSSAASSSTSAFMSHCTKLWHSATALRSSSSSTTSTSSVACFRVPDIVTPSRSYFDTLTSSDNILAFRGLLRNRAQDLAQSTRDTFSVLTSVGQDTLLLVRYPRPRGSSSGTGADVGSQLLQQQVVYKEQVEKLGNVLQSFNRRSSRGRRFSPLKKNNNMNNKKGVNRPRSMQSMSSYYTRLFNGGTGMLLSAAAGLLHGDRHAYADSSDYDRLAQEDAGLRSVGIGWIDPRLHGLLLLLPFLLLSSLFLSILFYYPFETALSASFLAVKFFTSTPPSLASFHQWVFDQAPKIAQRKHLLVNKLRAYIAPFLIQWAAMPCCVSILGPVTVVRLTDREGFMYMYAGAFDQWCLLGWYNTQDRYFTDRMADAMRECVTVVQNWWSSLSSSLSSPAFNPHVTVSVSVPMQTSTSTSWEDEEKKEQGIWWRQLPHNLTELRMLVSKEHAL